MYKVTVPVILSEGSFQKEKVLKELKRCKADRIGLALENMHNKEALKLLEDTVPFFQAENIEVLVWLGETLGHGASQAQEDGYRHIRFFDKGDIQACCPLDEKFQRDFCQWIREVAEYKPDIIMLDDDYRVGYRGGLGCCCELHMAEIQKELGESITEEELKVKAFSGERNRYRDAWMKVQGDSLKNFARKMREELDTVDPDIRLGLCSAPGSWDSEGTTTLELAEIMAGNTKPLFRITGAPYWVTIGDQFTFGGKRTIGDVVEYERMLAYWCKDKDVEFFTEGDTYPRPRHTSSAAELECFDLLLRADRTTDGILKYMLDYYSPADYETGYVDFHEDNLKLYEDIERLFADKQAVGVRPYCHREIFRDMDMGSLEVNRTMGFHSSLGEINWDMSIQMGMFNPAIHFAVRNSLPISYEPGGVNIVFGEQAKYIPEEELKFGTILDSTAAGILMKRGIDVGIQEFVQSREQGRRFFSDMPLEYDKNEEILALLWPGVTLQEMVLDPKAQVITQYKVGDTMQDGAFHYENAKGQRFLVYPYKAKEADGKCGWFEKYTTKRQVERSIAWLSQKETEVHTAGNYPMLYLMVKKNETSTSVAVCNLFNDKIKNARIYVNLDYENMEFINCQGHREGNEIVLDTVLYPYEFAAFELK